MKKYLFLITFLLPLLIKGQETIQENQNLKNQMVIDVGYTHSYQGGRNIFGKKVNPSGIFQQFQYSRNVHRFFDVYTGIMTSLILPTNNIIQSTGVLSPYPNGDTITFKFIERENSISVFVGFSFIPISKKVEWKINQDIGYNYISKNEATSLLQSISPPPSPLVNALWTTDKIYNTINYGVGSSVVYNLSERIALGVSYKSNLAFKMDKKENIFDDKLFYASHNVGLRIAVRF